MSKELDKNHQYCKKALALKMHIESNFLALGEYMHQIKENRFYEPFWASWNEFCDEMQMSVSSANRMIQVHETFVLKYQFSHEQLLRARAYLTEILPLAKTKELAEEWISKAEKLMREDLRKEKTEVRTGIPMAKCKHQNTYLLRICRDCGERHEEY